MSATEKKDEFVPTPAVKEATTAKPATTPAVAPPTSGMAIAGLVCAFLFPLLGLIFSIIGISQTKDNKRGGRVLAIIGLVVSILGMLIGLLWFVIFIIAAANTDTSNFDTSSSSNSSLSSLTDEQKPEVTAKLNESVRDGKFEFTVKSVECGKTTVGDQYYSATAQGEFCMVNVKVSNIGDEPQSIYSSSQYLYNSDGQKYSSDSSATSIEQTGNDVWWNDINPGNSVEGVIVYDVPKGMVPASVELHDSFFSDGVLVELK
jgi:hypothetical protein